MNGTAQLNIIFTKLSTGLPIEKKQEPIGGSFAASFVWKEPGGTMIITMADIIPTITITEISIIAIVIIITITGEIVLSAYLPGMGLSSGGDRIF